MCEQILTVYQVKLVRVRMTDEARKKTDELVHKGVCLGCLTPVIDGLRKVRGQCGTCYAATMSALSSCKTEAERSAMEKQLIESGKLLVAGKGGRKSSNPYTKQLAEMKG